MNPSTTLMFLRLRKMETWDAVFYMCFQFIGALAGVMLSFAILGSVLRDPSVNFAVTQPGGAGAASAFIAELIISFVLAMTVLGTSNDLQLSRLTPYFAATLVATYITFEAPFSGMSMNPARTFGSALPAHAFNALWIYFTPPPIGMLLAAELYLRLRSAQAVYCAKYRLRVWRPKRAAVMGSGTLGLLATLVLRLRGLDVTTFGNTMPPTLNSSLIEELGARYISTKQMSLTEASAKHGPFDLILEGTGYSPLVFEAMNVLAKNGALAMVSVTGGSRQVEVPADKINLGFVLGNKVAFGSVNANREYFETGVKDLSTAELQYPGWLKRLLTHRVSGLDNYGEMMRLLNEAKGSIKVYCQVSAVETRQTPAAAI
jgi:Glucose dehydrogenase C-terminus/Major intrinsic protein